MPTVILLDSSVSMIQPVPSGDTGETVTVWQLAVHGVNHFLDYLGANEKLESAALVTFSSVYEVPVNFTRDYDQIKSHLSKIEEQDKTSLEAGLIGVTNLVRAEWGPSIPCNIVLFTDASFSTVNIRSPHFPLPFKFTGKLHIVCLATSDSPGVAVCHRLVEMASTPAGVVLSHDPGTFTFKSVQNMVQTLAESEFSTYVGTLKCGSLTARIGLYPSPQSHTKVIGMDTIIKQFSETLDVCGFINLPDLGSPMAVSRHLVSPLPYGKIDLKAKQDVDIDEEYDEGKIPSLCVLFHGSLKVENVAALCKLDDDWFGVLYSWGESKKKSNLMLTVFEPGADAVPWLGDLNYLAALEEYPTIQPTAPTEPLSFPVRPAEKRSYSQNTVLWIRKVGLQSDIQKILRHARKLPEKTQQFYKELGRLRKGAVSFGFVELLDGLASVLEREIMLLPNGSHPDCSIQLRHAADLLRRPYSREYKFNLSPLKTNFNTDMD